MVQEEGNFPSLWVSKQTGQPLAMRASWNGGLENGSMKGRASGSRNKGMRGENKGYSLRGQGKTNLTR